MVDKIILWGGVGEKKSNKGTQYYIQDRIYDSNGICPALNTVSPYWVIIWENEEERDDNDGC